MKALSFIKFEYPCVWDALKESKKPLVIYGMGNGADKALDEAQKRNIPVYGVMASDDFVRYQQFRGFTVKKESDFEKEIGDFITALCFASSLPDVTKHIHKVAQRRGMLVPNVPVVGEEIIDDGFIDAHFEEIETAYSLLSDDPSKSCFEGALSFLYTGRLEYLDAIESGKDEVFRDILKLKEESYLDLGAYRGDTVEEFLRYTDGYRFITALEPNPKNFKKLTENTSQIKNIRCLNAGVSSEESYMFVSSKSGRMASLSDKGDIKIPVVSVDSLDISPSYIKADIEGMEAEMLKGAEKTLQSKPKLNIAAYHRSSDFFSLILQIHKINPDYRFFLRKHPYIPCWDLNIYAV